MHITIFIDKYITLSIFYFNDKHCFFGKYNDVEFCPMTIKFKLNDPLNPVALEAEEGFINVIMPIRKKAPAAQ